MGTASQMPHTLARSLALTASEREGVRSQATISLSPLVCQRARDLADRLGTRPDTPALAAWVLVLEQLSVDEQIGLVDQCTGKSLVLDVPGNELVSSWLTNLDQKRSDAQAEPKGAPCDTAFVRPEALQNPHQSGFVLIAYNSDAHCLDAAFDPAIVTTSLADALLAQTAAALVLLIDLGDAQLADLTKALDALSSVAVAGWEYSGPMTVTECFAEQVRLSPDRTALSWDGGTIDYLSLDRASSRIAAELNLLAPMAGACVAICMDRSPHAIAAMLGALKAGAAYVPIEPSFPGDRIRFMIADAQCAVVICKRDFACPNGEFERVVVDDTYLSAAAGGPTPGPYPSADSLAYVMYTSGSTGRPKGVEVLHRSIVRLVKLANFMQLDHSVAMLHAAPLGFDAATLEVWGPLLNGGRVIVNQELIPTGDGIERAIGAHGANAAWLTASLFNAIVDEDATKLQGLRELLTGGEALSVPHVRRALRALPEVRLINGYGPTECTTFATTYPIPREPDTDARSVPIGMPVSATSVHVLNARLRPVPRGLVGELHVGGLGLARGYLNQPDLTAERFVTLPGKGLGERVYRTGDLVRMRTNGVLEYLGRIDAQIKLRGYRIEVAEIETVLATHPAISSCAVVPIETSDRGLYLAAYIVPASGGSIDIPSVKRYLAERLPEFMVPPVFVHVDALPVTLNGKLDRRALPAPPLTRPELTTAYETPEAGVETDVASLFAHLLQIDRVGRRDNFFELGGSSLLVLRALGRLKEAGHTGLTVADFFSTPTPAALARRMQSDPDGVDPRRLAHMDRGSGRQVGTQPIAIVGMAGRFPGAPDVEALWSALTEGRDTIRNFADSELDPGVPTELRMDAAYVRARGVIDNVELFDPAFFGISPREAELMDPQQRLFLEIAWECIERAGYAPGPHLGPVGVFAGMYNATYFQKHVSNYPDRIERIGEFQVMLANEKDYIATRTSNRLGLTGPAISIHTACSTSLVAIAQAVDSLRDGRCVMALAGGASVTCPPNSGYLYQDGAMLSPDGHTRTFDADAQGTVFSDGAAVVLLKRLDDAIREGDLVHAVIRGVAVNNDGGDKASFTAPSVDGQAAVIAAALDDAGVDARSVGYVEAHGTATPLGDPVEVEALKRAFRRDTQDIGFCRLGSVKSNIGHTVIAAGATGVIKTALSLERGLIPANANFASPNPKIDFERSPFRVSDRLQSWPRTDAPRRAGVSSFGVGGTNAHAVLEEAPLRTPSPPAVGPQIIRLSARSDTALQAQAERLAVQLDSDVNANLADIAYTLRTGRTAFPHRLVVSAETAVEAAAALRTNDHPSRSTRVLPARAPEVLFAFPGQGAQYSQMGSRLYEQLPEFRSAFDDCLDALRGELEFDLKSIMFGGDPDALKATAITQPATFCLEYALAQFWIERGLRPAAMIGHSVGEFVAATVAGVMRLEDAVRLVTSRGRLMQALPGGSMLSVRASAEAITKRLANGLALAAWNAPNLCVVAGPTHDVESLRLQLESEGVVATLLQTSHAFHSSMMDQAVAPFDTAVRQIPLSSPRMPIISTLTGGRLSDAEATEPSYWARHLRETVKFSPAVRTALETSGRAFLEVGPRATLATLIRQHAVAGQPAPIALSSLGSESGTEPRSVALAIGQLWTLGIDVPWSDSAGDRQRVRLPTYPFERTRCWVDAIAPSAVAPQPAANLANTTQPFPMPLPPAPVSVDRKPALISRVKSLLEDVSGVELGAADPTMSFVELGLDSLTLTQAALQLKKAFKIEITFRQLMERYRSVDALATYLDAELPREAPAAAIAPIATAAGGNAMSTLPSLAAAPIPVTTTAVDASYVQQVIHQQMQLMAQQLALLQGTPAAATKVTPVTAPAPTLAKPAEAAPSAGDAPVEGGPIKYDVKSAFGAIARIHTTRTGELTERQRSRLDAFMRRYIVRTKKSKEYTVQHRPHLADPRVVNGFRPQLKEIIYQIVIERSKGAHLWDLDGNEYVDALNGFGMSLFGWQPSFVTDAVRRQLDSGYDIGPQHPLAGEVAKLMCEFTGFDRAGLCNTGSEAVMGTVRIARTVTGRTKIVIFSGAYHGIFDEVIVRGTKKLKSLPAAPGIMPNTSENVLVLEYGTPEALEVIKANADDIAAVLVEPVQSRRPDFQPREFLRDLRELTEKTGIVLVFDEVVTGFRCHPGGIQALWGIRADLASYGKVLGGGFPIGVIAGKRDFMDALDGGGWQYGDDSVPSVGVTYFAGTFVRHPLALAAAKASLEHMKREGPELQAQLTLRTGAMADELNAFCREVGAPIVVKHFASVWKTFFTEDHPLQDLLFAMMRSRGVHILDNFPCFFTTAHTDNDIATIKMAFKESVAELQEADFIPKRADPSARALDAASPPVPGARLGRDADGKPAWFVPNPDAPGKYVKVS